MKPNVAIVVICLQELFTRTLGLSVNIGQWGYDGPFTVQVKINEPCDSLERSISHAIGNVTLSVESKTLINHRELSKMVCKSVFKEEVKVALTELSTCSRTRIKRSISGTLAVAYNVLVGVTNLVSGVVESSSGSKEELLKTLKGMLGSF